MAQIVSSPADLAPGDVKSAALDLSPYRIDRIRALADPLFEKAYAPLWAEFGAKDEMESRSALERRFAAAPRLLYELLLVRRGEECIAVRDHTALLAAGGAVVHLSHNLVTPSARRTGLAGWMRAWPIHAARELLAASGAPADAPVTLIGEMEYDRPDDPARAIRLRAYERAGFVKIDPAKVRYHQPDFRAPEIIEAEGASRPLPFQLAVRRVGREGERTISGREVRELVRAVHATFEPHLAAGGVAQNVVQLHLLPPDDATIALLPPTQC